MEQYIKNALLTEGKNFDSIRERLTDNKIKRMVYSKMIMAVHALNHLDMVKKYLYYGKTTEELEAELETYKYAGNLPDIEIFNDRMLRTIHAAMGIATEGGELIEAVLKVFKQETEQLDEVNILEECGDVDWYQALLADEFNFTFKECQEINNKKLAKRFNLESKMGFTEEDAINRDLKTERDILEGK